LAGRPAGPNFVLVQARAPLDIDLEDKLLYGLTATRLAYAVIAFLAAFTLWSTPWAPDLARACASLLVVAAGAAAAWGRWRGRGYDGWAWDLGVFALRRYRVTRTT